MRFREAFCVVLADGGRVSRVSRRSKQPQISVRRLQTPLCGRSVRRSFHPGVHRVSGGALGRRDLCRHLPAHPAKPALLMPLPALNQPYSFQVVHHLPASSTIQLVSYHVALTIRQRLKRATMACFPLVYVCHKYSAQCKCGRY